MKLKLVEAVQGFNALQRIGIEKMPIKLAYTIQRNMRLLEADVRAYEEKRVDLIKTKYGVKDEEDNFKVPPKRFDAFQKQLNQLGQVEIEVAIQTIPMEDVTFNISPNDLIFLEWLFVDGDTPKPARKRHK